MVDRLAPARGIVLSVAAGAMLWLVLGLAVAGWRAAGGAMTEPAPYALASALLWLALGLAWLAVR